MDFEAEQASSAGSSTLSSAGRTEAAKNATKLAAPIVLIVSILFVLPFVLIGVVLLAAGIWMVSEGQSNADALIGFSVMWILLSGFIFAICLVAFFKLLRKNKAQDDGDDYRPSSKSDDDDWDNSRYDDYE